MSDSILRNKSKDFAKNIIYLCRELKLRKFESAIINQLLRSGTSVGANIYEGKYAQGCKDLVSKFEIALKELNESEYWIELLIESGYYDDKSILENCIELKKMLISSINTAKKNNN